MNDNSPVTEQQVLDSLRSVIDPDLRRSIVDLGFVKNLKISGDSVAFDLELTTPACPVRDVLKQSCIDAVRLIPGMREVSVNLTARTRGTPPNTRELLKSVGNIVAIASGKGGVAKSTTAVNIAAALSLSGASVGLLDADIYGPSLPTMLKVHVPPAPSDGDRIYPAEASGIKLMSIAFFMPPGQAAILRGPMVSGYVTQFLAKVDWGELDYLIIDYPPGTGDIQLTLSQQAPISGAVIVTTPQEISVIDVTRAVQMFEATRVPVLGVVETMSYFVCDQCKKRHHIFRSGGGERIAHHAGIPFLGAVPIDPQVAEGGDRGMPIVLDKPESAVARAYTTISGAVAAELSILNMERGSYLESFSLEWM